VRFLLKLVFAVIVACSLWLGWGLLLPKRAGGDGRVLLHPGWGSRRIAAELKNAGVIRSTSAFLLVHAARMRPLKAGEYLFDHWTNGLGVYDRIARGDIYFHEVTIPEGYNLFDIATVIENAQLGKRDDFIRVARGETVLVKDIDPDAHSLEGYLFPDTYRFTGTQTMHDMAAAMVHRFRQEAHQIGLVPNPGARNASAHLHSGNFNLHRIVTMASIVEKETAAPAERATVAGVYYNRLQRNMPLQADPSVIYASLLAGRFDGSIHRSDLDYESLYNTYRFAGLPPGPIANPGRASLEAAMHPTNSDYLYFVSDGNGHHRFARTLEEHDKNVVAYRRAVAGIPNH
jgi:UPF0755 protein